MIEEQDYWEKNPKKIPINKILNLQIGFNEKDLRLKVKNAGGLWNGEQKVWKLAYKKILELGLEERIVKA